MISISELYTLFKNSNGATTDTRKIEPQQLFFALKGASFNANSFAEQAIAQGASYAIVDEVLTSKHNNIIVVEDVLHTLQQLALYHRQQVQPKAVIAITGSNGKTTTKELVASVLQSHFITHYTKGNLNNHIGIPLTLLAMPTNTEIAVIEMGANHQQEITSYCLYTAPTHGIITNIGKAHLEGFGGIEGIKKGKGELYDYLIAHHSSIFYNADDGVISEMVAQRNYANTLPYTISDADTQLIESYPSIQLRYKEHIIQSNLFGNYNLSNILCAINVGAAFKVPSEKIKHAIENYFPDNKRSELVSKDNYKLILDYYNANPTSMQHALENFSLSKSTKRIVILGDMFELGTDSAKEHQQIANLAEQLKFETVVLVGTQFFATKTNHALKFETTAKAKKWFQEHNKCDAEILIKGSRGMKMEELLN